MASLRFAGDALLTDVAEICDLLQKRRRRKDQKAQINVVPITGARFVGPLGYRIVDAVLASQIAMSS